MKIIQVIFGLYSGGAERFVADLSNELAKDVKNQVTILALKSKKDKDSLFYKEELSDSVMYDSLEYMTLSFAVFFKIYQYIRKNSPDIVHFHMTTQYALLPILFHHKCKYIETIHNQVELRGKYLGPFSDFVNRTIYKSHNIKVAAISDQNNLSFSNYFHIKCDCTIYNGREIPQKSPNFDDAKEFIDSMKKDKDTVVITHIARFHKQKNQKLLFDSFDELIDKGYNVILLVIGGGFEQEQKVERKNVYFLGKQQYVADYLYNSDAFCLSSLWEGMPITLIEAFACGCIPIGTPVSGFTDLVKDGTNGYISKDFSQEAFASMLKKFMNNFHTIDRSKLIELYNRKLSIALCAESYMSLYKEKPHVKCF